MLKYELVANDIRQKIETGEYLPNKQLPSTEELCDLYEVSKTTINKAMDALTNQGLVSRRRGAGTYVLDVVKEPLDARTVDLSSQMAGFTAEHGSERVGTRVIDFTVAHPDKRIASLLRMEADEFAYRIVRVRTLDGEPHVIEYTHMPINVIPNLRLRDVETSIYGFIRNDLGLVISSAHRTIRAVLPSHQEMECLSVSKTTPLLEVEQVGFLGDGTPFEYSISRHAKSYELRSVSIWKA